MNDVVPASLLKAAAAAELVGKYDEAERLAVEVLNASVEPMGVSATYRASALIQLAAIDCLRANYPQALSRLNDALILCEEASDRAGLAKALGAIGTVNWNLSNHQIALESFERALSIEEDLGNKIGVAALYGSIGLVHWTLSDYPKSLEYYERALSIDEALGNKAGIARHLGNIGNVQKSLSDYPKALEYLFKALSIDEELGHKVGVTRHLGNIGIVYRNLSDYPRALEFLEKSLRNAEELGHKSLVANNLGNIGIVHKNLSDYSRSLEFYAKALSISEDLGERAGVASWLANIGNLHSRLSDYPMALDYYYKALEIAEDLGNKAGAAIYLGNIGNVYGALSDHLKAEAHFNKSLKAFEDLANRSGVAIQLGRLGHVRMVQRDFDGALAYYLRGLHLNQELGMRSEAADVKGRIGALYANIDWKGRDEAKAETFLLESIESTEELGTKNYEAHRTLANLYEHQERWRECALHLKKYHELKDEVQSEEAKKSAVQMEQRRQIAEREKEIAIAKAAADAQMSATTGLLHKVLPESVATRMINGDDEIADYYPQVSILFADIAGFTPISADMPAIVVVRFLNYVFAEFDRIIKKHGCEKIKTIGDGYMAVAGAPIECADHAERLAAAALEMQETITLPESIREYMPSGVTLGVRIGLHTGSVVAGVIGEERFVYDIYSDAVNTAARMESHGEENKIHVSNDFFRHLQNRFAMTKNTTHGFVFEKRGEMEIKGKGLMRTYFLEKV